MKIAKLASLSSVLLITIPLTSQAATLDLRGGYRSGSHAYETRIKVSESWKSGWAASLETDSWNTTHDNNNKLIALNYNEMEVSYNIPLSDKWSLRPGILTHWDKGNGTRLGPYLKLSYDVNKALNLGIRYRYDYNVNTSAVADRDGHFTRKDQHRWDGYVTYKITDKWTVAWQTTVYTYVNNFHYGNHKRWATENAFVVLYKLTPRITPYIEYDYLDRQGSYKGRDNITENSYRVGVAIAF